MEAIEDAAPGSIERNGWPNRLLGELLGTSPLQWTAMGAGVRSGRHYGTWPGLQDTLDGDLLVRTDQRSVLTEVVTKRFGVSVAQVFPGFAPRAVSVMA